MFRWWIIEGGSSEGGDRVGLRRLKGHRLIQVCCVLAHHPQQHEQQDGDQQEGDEDDDKEVYLAAILLGGLGEVHCCDF